MIIKSKGKEYELTFKSRQMIRCGDEIGGQYELELGAYKGDIKLLAKAISIFSDALSYEEALDYIDEAIEEGRTIRELYSNLFEEMNKTAFFTKKLEVSELPPINYQMYMEKITSEIEKELASKTKEEALENMSSNLSQ